jgi:hypothetical protein
MYIRKKGKFNRDSGKIEWADICDEDEEMEEEIKLSESKQTSSSSQMSGKKNQ